MPQFPVVNKARSTASSPSCAAVRQQTFPARDRHAALRTRHHAHGACRQRPTDQNGQPDLRSRLVQALAEGLHFADKAGLDVQKVMDAVSQGAASSWQMVNRHKTMIAGRVRTRLCRRLDAQGSGDLPGRSPPDWRITACNRTGGSVVCRSSGHGRGPMGYLQPAGETAKDTNDKRGRRRLTQRKQPFIGKMAV
jgi:hypothetical protein